MLEQYREIVYARGRSKLKTTETQKKYGRSPSCSLETLNLLFEGALYSCVTVSKVSRKKAVNLPLQLSFASPNSIFVFSM